MKTKQAASLRAEQRSADSDAYSFESKRKQGRDGEHRVARALGAALSIDTSFDFIMPDGRKVELKTEGYPPNFLFVELYGNHEDKRIGGPFRAERDGIPLYGHLFEECGLLLLFKTESIVTFMKENSHRFKRVLPKSSRLQGSSSPTRFEPALRCNQS